MENESLLLDLLEWLHQAPRAYEELMDAWRTSCPRLTIWEDARDAGFVAMSGQSVHITSECAEFLDARRERDRAS